MREQQRPPRKGRREFLVQGGLAAGAFVAAVEFPSMPPFTSSAHHRPDFTRAGDDGVPANWHRTNAPIASSRYDDIWFQDERQGWAVNTNSQILYTSDGGDSWQQQYHEPNVYMRCLAFSSPDCGWVGTLTEGKILYGTRNGGKRWTPVSQLPSEAPVAICGMWAVNDLIVYAAGSNRPEQPVRMMKTWDGGKTWTSWDMRKWADNLVDVFFISPNSGWVVGGRADDRKPVPTKSKLRPVVLYTEDKGVTWVDRLTPNRDNLPVGEWGWKIQFLNEKVGFVSLESYEGGAILSTVDGGKTWIRRPVNDPQMNTNLQGIGFLNKDHGWVGGWGDQRRIKRACSETLDGGRTWRSANGVGRSINRFRFVGSPTPVGYAAGETVYKYSPWHHPIHR